MSIGNEDSYIDEEEFGELCKRLEKLLSRSRKFKSRKERQKYNEAIRHIKERNNSGK